MSHIVYENTYNNFEFNFSKNLKGLKTKKPKYAPSDFKEIFVGFNYDIYSLCDNICLLVDYNTKGLLENIIYLKMLMKKGKIKLSLDLFEEHIEELLISNYKYNIFKEFCLINEYREHYCKKYATEDAFHFHGMEFMLKVKAYLLWAGHIYMTQTFNEQNETFLNNIDFDNLNPSEEAILNSAVDEKKQVYLNDFSYDYIIKICKKIVKCRRSSRTVNITKLTINEIRIYDEIRNPQTSTTRIHFPCDFYSRLFPIESDDYNKFLVSNKYRLNIMSLFGNNLTDYEGYTGHSFFYKDF